MHKNPQQQASHPQHSTWVEASAGTGKTKVLIDRLLSLLLVGADFEKILCLTYTKAAALEMTERLVARLDAWATMSDAQLKSDMEDLGLPADKAPCARSLRAKWQGSPQGVDIQTIHSFCQKTLNTFPIEAGVTPYFQVMDATKIQQGFGAAIKQIASENPSDLGALLVHRTWQSIQDILQALFSERYKWQVRGGQEKIIKSVAQDLSMPEKPMAFSDLLLPNKQDIILSLSQEGVGAQKISTALDVWHVSAQTPEDFLSISQAFLTQKGDVRQRLYPKKWGENYVTWAADIMTFAQHIQDMTQQQKKTVLQDYSVHMATLFSKSLAAYTSWKQVQGYLDYDDLIFKTQKLLEDVPAALWVRYKLDMNIDHVLVDEAQDTNPTQWAIIQKIISDFFNDESDGQRRTFFVVGDPKQSIFSFQGAHMATFHATKCQLMDQYAALQTVQLTTSFRATAPTLKFVDTLFSHHPHLGDVPAHLCHRAGQGGGITLWPLIEPPEKIYLKPWQVADKPFMERSAQTRLAEEITGKIQGWVSTGRCLAGTNRSVQPKDIMILVRKRDAFVGAMIRALKAAGIPVHGDEKILLNEHIVIQDMKALSDFLMLPQNDMALALVLKSPLIGMTEEDLFELSYKRPTHLWCALKARGQVTGATYHTAYTFLARLLNKVGYSTPYDFYMLVLYKYQKWQAYLARMGAEINGVIDAFLSILEKTSSPGLDVFWKDFNEANHAIARPVEEDAVRIMTVHGSKGLQAPIVIMPDTTQIPRVVPSYFWTKNSYVCLPKSTYMVPEIEVLQVEKETAQLDEYYRLLYVAMTRAEEELYIGGWMPASGVPEGSWYSLLSDTVDRMAEFKEGTWHMEGARREGVEYEIQRTTDVLPKAFSNAPARIKNRIAPTPNLVMIDDVAAQDGIRVHTFLEHVIDVPAHAQSEFMHRFVAENGLPSGTAQAVKSLLNDDVYQKLLSLPHQVEMPISGGVDGENVRRHIDFCAIDTVQKKIYILEYKTVRKTRPEIREKDKKQLESYKEILSCIYPEYVIDGVAVYINIVAGTCSWER